jgi:hypothetical protein
MQDRLTNEALIERFNNIMEWVNKLTGVRINTGAKLEEAYSIQNTCLRLLESIKDNELTAFMVAPILEHYLTLLRPAIVIPVDDLLAGNHDKWNAVSELVTDLAEHPVRNQWAARAETFRQIAESAGYTFERSDYQDLAIIAPIVADALTTFDESHYIRTVYKMREGEFSNASPILLDEVHIFQDIADAIQIYERIPVPAFIGFFGVEKTYGQTNNAFDDWRYGRNARKNNVMKNGMTEEEYAAKVDEHSRKVYCMIRDGGNFWIFQPPINTSHNECTQSNGSFTNFYGHRSTYAPIQIFWDRFASDDTTSTALVPYKPRKWSLKEILDEDQKVWLPIFFNTVKARFFTDVEPKAEHAMLLKETKVTLQLTGAEQNTNLPAIVQHSVQLPTMDELFTRDKVIDEEGRYEPFIGDRERLCYRGALDLLYWLGITADDIAEAPIGFYGLQTNEEAIEAMEIQTVAAYYKIIRERLPEFWKTEALKASKWFRDKVSSMHSQIVADINDGRTQAKIHVHKKPVLDENGMPVMRKQYSWREEMVPVTDETDIDIGKMYIGNFPYMHPYQWFSSPSLIDKRPPVTVSVYCKTPEDIAHMLRCEVKDLPLAIQYMQYTNAFCDRHARFCADVHFIYNKSDFKKTFPNF